MAKKTSISETSPEILMLGFLSIKGVEGLTEKISILDRFGLTDDDIATICACTTQSVRNERWKLKKKRK